MDIGTAARISTPYVPPTSPSPSAPTESAVSALQTGTFEGGRMVREFLNGKVPERGSPVIDLVNRMIF